MNSLLILFCYYCIYIVPEFSLYLIPNYLFSYYIYSVTEFTLLTLCLPHS